MVWVLKLTNFKERYSYDEEEMMGNEDDVFTTPTNLLVMNWKATI